MSTADVSARADADAVSIWARQSPHRLAVIESDGRSLTYGELDRETDRVVHTWAALGVRAGDRVALWMQNSADYLIVYLACLRAGAVIVQLNHRHTAVEASYQLTASEASVLVFDDSVADRVGLLDAAVSIMISLGHPMDRSTQSLPELVSRAPEGRARPTPIAPEDLAVLGFTSGTTGHPKAAELTHGSIRSIGDTNMISCRYTMGSVQIFAFSLSFTAGIPAHVLPHFRVGGTTVLLRAWDTERLVDAIERHRATFTLIPSPPLPELCEIIEARPRALDSVVSLLHSTAKAPEAHLERLVASIGPRLIEGWGMTENSGGLVTATTSSDYESRRARIFSSAGSAVPGAQLRVVDEQGAELPRDGTTVGVLEVRTPSLARGYWQDGEATRAAFRHGWFSTGDLGSLDDDGYVYLVDRRADLIVSGGMNVYPSEIERVLAEAPDVAACAVVGVPHERWGRTPIAFVVPRTSSFRDSSRIIDFARGRLASYKIPSQIRFVDALPTNSGGKIVRRALMALVEDET